MNLNRFRNRSRKDADLAEELESHLAHSQDMREARDVSPDEAYRQARVKLGNARTVREDVWRYRSIGWIEDLLRDMRFAVRSLGKTPGFTLIALAVIAVGIGVNTAVFSVINTVLLKPLHYPDPQSLVQLQNVGPQGRAGGANVPKLNIWRRQTSVFQDVAAYDFGGAGMNLTGGNQPQQVQAVHVTANYFSVFGAPVALGRTFTQQEDSPHGGDVVVLSYGLWKSHFGGNPKIVGTTIQLDSRPYLVVGVLGQGFVTEKNFGAEQPADLWTPFQFDLNSQDMAHYFTAIARLKPGVTLAQAEAQMKLAADEYRRTYGPNSIGPQGSFGVENLQESMIGSNRKPLLILMTAVGFVLLIGCANVMNLLLARASARKRELATRAALGAGRTQIIRQLLVESVMLSLSGGALGLLLGYLGVRALLALSPGDLPRLGENGAAVTLDLHVLAFTFGVSVLTGILCGLIPAIGSTRSNLLTAINEGSQRSGLSFRRGKLRSSLVVGEMALALILVIGATLLIRTFSKVAAVDPGFDPHNVITMTMSVSGERFQKTTGIAQIVRDGTDRLKAVPGVVDAGNGNGLPMVNGFGMTFDIVGRPKGKDPFTGGAGYLSVGGDYFQTLKVPLIRGRYFNEHDDGAAPGVVIINEAFAKQYWPHGDPLKDRMQIGVGAGPVFAEPARQVIGIVGDTHQFSLDQPAPAIMYTPLAQLPDAETALNSRVAPLVWAVRTQSDPHAMVNSITAALRDASGGLPVAHIRTMEEIEGLNMARQRFNMTLLIIFGAAGMLMAAIGVYGVMAYSVQQRTQEMGVRMALGAQAANLRNMVIGQGMALALAGVVIGVGGAFWLTRFLAGFLFGVKTWDPATFIATPLLLAIVALLATWIPARRATRVDPMTALRLE